MIPTEGYGSWAQWRERITKQGGMDCMVDNQAAIGHPWVQYHVARGPASMTKEPQERSPKVLAQRIADTGRT